VTPGTPTGGDQASPRAGSAAPGPQIPDPLAGVGPAHLRVGLAAVVLIEAFVALQGSGGAAAGFAVLFFYPVVAAFVWWRLRDVAARDGWSRTLGWGDGPHAGWRTWLGRAVGTAVVCRVASAAVILALEAIPGLSGAGTGNSQGLKGLSPAGYLFVIVFTCLFAPLVEETVYRGLVLRGIWRARGSFGLAAAVSTALFGVGHVSSLDGAAVGLFCGTAVFGIGAALLLRRHGTVAATASAHAVFNLTAVVLVAATS
jgi:membrane protease YdiL (CAAX protease family)